MRPDWNPSKSAELKKRRGMSFEEIEKCRPVKVLAHPKRANQKILLVERDGYIWEVPFVETSEGIFYKTLYRSRKYTRAWKRGELR